MILVELNNSYCLHSYIKLRPEVSDKGKKNELFTFMMCLFCSWKMLHQTRL